MTKYIYLTIFLAVFCCCSHNKRNIERVISKDSLQYWDLRPYGKSDTKIILTYCFKEDGTYLMYDVDNDYNRRVMTYGDGRVAIKKWAISNDSSFTINVAKCKIVKYNNDTIFFGEKSNMLVRVKNKMNVINQGDPGDTLKRFKSLALPD